MRPRFDAKKFIAGRPPSGAQRNAKPGIPHLKRFLASCILTVPKLAPDKRRREMAPGLFQESGTLRDDASAPHPRKTGHIPGTAAGYGWEAFRPEGHRPRVPFPFSLAKKAADPSAIRPRRRFSDGQSVCENGGSLQSHVGSETGQNHRPAVMRRNVRMCAAQML